MGKVAVSIYHIYGGGSGEELFDRFVIEDSSEMREKILNEETGLKSISKDFQDFIDMKRDCFYYETVCCHKPTEALLLINTEDELIKEAENYYETMLRQTDELFGF